VKRGFYLANRGYRLPQSSLTSLFPRGDFPT